MIIKLFPDPIEGSGTVIAAPVKTTTRHEPLKPVLPSTPSAETLAREFSAEQLPSLDDSVGYIPKKDEVTGEVKVEPKTETKTEVKTEDGDKSKAEPQPFIKPPKGEKKEEVKVEGEVKKEEPKKEEQDELGKVKLPSRSEDPFDYKGFTEEEVGILKPLSLNAREKVGKVLKQNKELQVGTYLQHPDAYAITPEYKQAQMDKFYLNREAQILTAQLEDVKLGKPIKKFLGWDNKDNESYGEDIQPNGALEESMRMQVQKTYGAAQDLTTRMNVYAQNFKTNIQQDTQVIENEQKNRFAWVADPKLLDHEIVFNGKDVPLRKVRDDFTNLFPTYMRGQQGISVAANLMVSLAIAQAEIQYLKGTKQVEKVKVEEEKRVEPSSQSRPAPKSQPKFGEVREFSVAGAPEGI
jgi:hypothetical protein